MTQAVKVYNCRVRLGGSLLHEVPKERISGEEVRLLRHIHGDDAIVDLRELGTLEGYTRDEELNSLADRFAQEADKRDGRKLVEKVFGVSLDDFDRWLLNKEAEAEDHAEQRQALADIDKVADKRGTFVRTGTTQ